VLHATSVTASIRLFSLWRGRLEIDTISVDEASLNLVRTPNGRWNLDPLLRSAATQAQSVEGGNVGPKSSGQPVKLPYLEATHFRINIKNGVEKLPFSLVDAEMSLWQQNPGDWRVRLKGQPARTDLSLDQADTGILRLNARIHQAPELRQMPLHVDMEWREAQLGQLTRLIFGSDEGWRGDLTGQLSLDGTAEAAQVKSRLRATGVHRNEFAPAEPLDFDANCGFVFHYSERSIENMNCDSPLGAGHIRLTGNLPGDTVSQAVKPSLSVELDRVPVAAGLDALRTIRSGMAPTLEAKGTASGKLTYAPVSVVNSVPDKPAHSAKRSAAKNHPPVETPLTGSIVVEGLQVSGSGLSAPVSVAKFTLEPALVSASQPLNSTQPQSLAATFSIPAGAPAPLTISAHFSPSGYHFTLRGQAAIVRARELAHAVAVGSATLDAVAGDPVSIDLTAEGPWMPTPQTPFVNTAESLVISAATPSDKLIGTVTLHNANWKSDFLATPVQISQATLRLESNELRWDSVAFSYGPVKGTASLQIPAACESAPPCTPHFELQFGAIDAAVLQTAFLGAQKSGTMLSTLIDRIHHTAAPAWPRIEGTVKADSLLLGPVTLHQAVASVRVVDRGAEVVGLDAGLLGGKVHGSGSFRIPATPESKPAYVFEGEFTKLNPAVLGQLFSQHWSGASFDATGKIDLSGYTEKDLTTSAKGTLHFDWKRGAVAATSGAVPSALTRFDHWSADTEIANGTLTLKENQAQLGSQLEMVEATAALGPSAKIAFVLPKQAPEKH
jgi:hypothetical protein